MGGISERHGHSWSSRRLYIHGILRESLQREQRDGSWRAVGPLGCLLKRDSVSTHRRRHRISYLPLSPLNLNLVHTLGKISSCLSPAVQCSVFANKSGHCAP